MRWSKSDNEFSSVSFSCRHAAVLYHMYHIPSQNWLGSNITVEFLQYSVIASPSISIDLYPYWPISLFTYIPIDLCGISAVFRHSLPFYPYWPLHHAVILLLQHLEHLVSCTLKYMYMYICIYVYVYVYVYMYICICKTLKHVSSPT